MYVTTMYRWGDRDGHSYLIGVFSSAELAIKAGNREERNRAGKYAANVVRVELDADASDYDATFHWHQLKGLPDQRPIILRHYKAFELVTQLTQLAAKHKGALQRPGQSLATFCQGFLGLMEDVK